MQGALRPLGRQLTFLDPGKTLSAEDALMWDPDGLHFSQIGSYTLGKSLAKLVLELCAAGQKVCLPLPF